jgi:hypothetical protein
MPLPKLAGPTRRSAARLSRLLACTALIGSGLFAPAEAQVRLSGASDADWTVLTMSPDGAWGTATDEYLSHAIAVAIARCRTMSGRALGCGAYQVSVQRSWALGARCGHENILATGATLAKAIENGRLREAERRILQPGMGVCRQVAIVSPDGSVRPPSSDAVTYGLNADR